MAVLWLPLRMCVINSCTHNSTLHYIAFHFIQRSPSILVCSLRRAKCNSQCNTQVLGHTSVHFSCRSLLTVPQAGTGVGGE